MVVNQLRKRGIIDTAVLDAMSTVPRHRFVSRIYRSMAYTDNPLPIGHGQTISQPYVVALMTQLLQVDRKHKVLEIGTGCGYQTAILSILSKKVITFEVLSLDITFEANLSPEGSPVRTNILFISLIKTSYFC